MVVLQESRVYGDFSVGTPWHPKIDFFVRRSDMKERILGFALAICMVFCIASNALAGGEFTTIKDEYGNVVGSLNKEKDESGDGWSYDASTQTLTLNNFHGGYIFTMVQRIVLIGDNTIQRIDATEIERRLVWLISESSGTIEGNGTLTIFGGMQYTSPSDFLELKDNQTITGGQAQGDTSPLRLKNDDYYTAEGRYASYVRIAPSENPAAALTGDFTDVPFSAWYYDAVAYVHKPVYSGADYGLMDGTTATTFSPDAKADRATIITALYRQSGDNAITVGEGPDSEFVWASLEAELPYTDVSRELFPAVWWANENNITGGYGDGRFGPNDPVTREQFAVFLYRFAQEKYNRSHDDAKYQLSARADLSGYTDSSQISSWAKDAMSWANAMGYITGVTDTTLNPSANVSRAEVATILMRAMVL